MYRPKRITSVASTMQTIFSRLPTAGFSFTGLSSGTGSSRWAGGCGLSFVGRTGGTGTASIRSASSSALLRGAFRIGAGKHFPGFLIFRLQGALLNYGHQLSHGYQSVIHGLWGGLIRGRSRGVICIAADGAGPFIGIKHGSTIITTYHFAQIRYLRFRAHRCAAGFRQYNIIFFQRKQPQSCCFFGFFRLSYKVPLIQLRGFIFR